MTGPEGQGGLSDAPFESGSLSASQEARAATVGHPHRLRSRTHREDVSYEEPRVSRWPQGPQPQTDVSHTFCAGMASTCLSTHSLSPKPSTSMCSQLPASHMHLGVTIYGQQLPRPP